MQNQRAWGGEKQHILATPDHTAETALLSSKFVGYGTGKQSANLLQEDYDIF